MPLAWLRRVTLDQAPLMTSICVECAIFHQGTCCQGACAVIGADGHHQGQNHQSWFTASAVDVIATWITRGIPWPEQCLPNRCSNDLYLCLSDVNGLLVHTWELFRGNTAKFHFSFILRRRATSLLTGGGSHVCAALSTWRYQNR